jgi:hypothetical protein
MIGTQIPVDPRPAKPKKRHSAHRESTVPRKKAPRPTSARQNVITQRAPKRSVRNPVRGETLM